MMIQFLMQPISMVLAIYIVVWIIAFISGMCFIAHIRNKRDVKTDKIILNQHEVIQQLLRKNTDNNPSES